MTDARWLEVDDDIESSAKHFRNAAALFDEGLSAADDLPSYKGRMAFMQAMQAGYTSLEGSFERILEILGEEKPTSGGDYHAQVVRRIGRAIRDDRPAILTGTLLHAVDEARRFRHVVRKGYDDFDLAKIGAAVDAARMISTGIQDAIKRFRETMTGDGDGGEGLGGRVSGGR
ncbi:hypothetical protein DFR50_12279 [Roseiarcus fermentans]|uniref:HepT-like domain-containing protein n=1 Tax=Roseiarcus fermentans TaxID=1473586 RepID=A0A366F3K6_9HYPH|nr:hypothetical protein [Roseiarcus fermentans]RBP09242.1 hypothetical protein DFR50_12279 [Roseiarcus fermentans]